MQAGAHLFGLCLCCHRLDYPVHGDYWALLAVHGDCGCGNNVLHFVIGFNKTQRNHFIVTFLSLSKKRKRRNIRISIISAVIKKSKVYLSSSYMRRLTPSSVSVWIKYLSVNRKPCCKSWQRVESTVATFQKLKQYDRVIDFTYTSAQKGSSSDAKDDIETERDQQGQR